MLSAREKSCVTEALVLCSFLSGRDPRLAPAEKRQQAQQAHAQYNDKNSDYVAVLNLWQHLGEQKAKLSNSQFRQYCDRNWINFNSYREWVGIARQLQGLFKVADLTIDDYHYQTLHRVLLSGFVSYVGHQDPEEGYQGSRNQKFLIHPSSGIYRSKPKWLMAFEIMETSRVYSRMNAKVEPEWVEAAGAHLLKPHYFDPFWSKSKGVTMAYLQLTLYGLIVVANRKVDYSEIDPKLSREQFLLHGLVLMETGFKAPFIEHNREQMRKAQEEESRLRDPGLRLPEHELARWFDERVPADIVSFAALNRWLKKDRGKRNEMLSVSLDLLLKKKLDDTPTELPKTLEIRGVELKLSYHFEPGSEDDGVTVQIPAIMLEQFIDADFERLVPGLLAEKIKAMIKGLPKRYRKHFLPIDAYAEAVHETSFSSNNRLTELLGTTLHRMTGVIIPNDVLQSIELPKHLLMRIALLDEHGKVTRSGRSVEQLVAGSSSRPQAARPPELLKKSGNEKAQKPVRDWQFGSIEQQLEGDAAGHQLRFFQGLQLTPTDAENESDYAGVVLAQFPTQESAQFAHRQALARLALWQCEERRRYLLKSWQNKAKLALEYATLGDVQQLMEQAMMAAVLDMQPLERELIWSADSFRDLANYCAKNLVAQTNAVLNNLLKSLQLRNQVIRTADQVLSEHQQESRDDIEEQLGDLFCTDFMARWGVTGLNQFPRYLGALLVRLERAEHNYPKELENLRAIRPWQQRWRKLASNYETCLPAQQQLVDDWFERFQELRISWFAPTMKTRYPISEKRLEKALDAVWQ